MGKRLKIFTALLAASGLTACAAPNPPAPAQAPATLTSLSEPTITSPTTETVVFLRHGEKPQGGMGQLTPQGFNRALALSVMLPQKFGKSDYLFAPDPHEKVTDSDTLYYYVRPLATIEPTAIRLGLPVQSSFGFRDTDELVDELCKSKYTSAMVFVVWEHVYAQKAAADLYAKFGGLASTVPQWEAGDYDSLYVVTIRRTPDHGVTATFSHEREGLDGQSMQMPSAAVK